MGIEANFIVISHILVTMGIILVPIIFAHDANPYQSRADQAIRKLRSRDDSLQDMYEVEDDDIEEALPPHMEASFHGEWVKLTSKREDDHFLDLLSDVDFEDINVGYLQRGDPGFNIILDAIAQNRTIRKDEVITVGLMSGPLKIFKGWDRVDEIPLEDGVPISPNAGLFVDYDNGLNPERELVHLYPSSPFPTLYLEDLQMWTKEAIRRKAHHATVALALIWVLTSVLTMQ